MTWVLLFVGEFLNWSTGLAGLLIAILVKPRTASMIASIAAGAFFGLVGAKFELFDLYLTAGGWQSLDGLALTVIALSALACLLWWVIGRVLYTLVLRLTGRAGPP